MARLTRLLGGLKALFHKQRVEQDLDEELRGYLDTSIDEKMRAGMAREEAIRAARVELGSAEAVKDDTRDAGWEASVESLWRDVRYAARTLRRDPAFFTVAVLTLALGLGANTAMFAVVNAVLLGPLPFRDAERLMLVHLLAPDRDRSEGAFSETIWSYTKYRAFLDVQQIFDSTALFADRDFAIAGEGAPERVRGEVITDRYPAILGIAPIVGRPFTGDETHRPGSQPVALLGHSLWIRRYAGDPSLVGRTIHVNSTPHTVVGVLPAGFRGLSGNADIWIPLAVFEPTQIDQREAYSYSYTLVARRRRSVTAHAAINAMQVYGRQIDAAFPDRFSDSKAPWGATATSLYDSRADADVRRASFVLLGAVGFVLLIACVNLTNLFVARAATRAREVAVRVALGATRQRIARQFLLEALLLTGAGAVMGLLTASGLLRAAAVLLPDSEVFFSSPIAPGIERMHGAAGLTRIGASMIGLDGITLLFTCAIAILAGLLIALAPALQTSALRPIDAIKIGGGAGTSRGIVGPRVRPVLVTAQIALALVLLAGAGLMLKSAFQLQRTPIGVNPGNVLTVRLELPDAEYTPEIGAVFYARLVDRLRALPGVAVVGLGSCAPISGGCNGTSFWQPRLGPRRGPGRDPLVGIHWATEGYFSALGIQVLRGRNFNNQDLAGGPRVAVVNEETARMFWPNDTPIGKIIALGQGGFGDGAKVIGVVSNVRYRTIETAPERDVFVPLTQSYRPFMTVFVRSSLDPQNLTTAIRREVRALDPNLPVAEVKTMEERLGDAMWRTTVAAWLFSAFAALAVVLTAIGIVGVMSQTVSQRTQEIGVRMALGAESRDVLALMLRRAALLSGAGIAIGVAGALVLTHLMTALLYEVEPGDPSTLAVVALVLGFVALVSCYVPARRAARVDPVVALRTE